MSCVAATCLFWRNPPTSLCRAESNWRRVEEGTHVLLDSMSSALCPIQVFLQLSTHLFGGCTTPLSLLCQVATFLQTLGVSCCTPSEADVKIATHTSEIHQFLAHSPTLYSYCLVQKRYTLAWTQALCQKHLLLDRHH